MEVAPDEVLAPRTKQPRPKPPECCIIYALCDPRGDEPIRYIGQTRRGMDRPKRHTQASCANKNGNPYLTNWLRQLFNLGLKPKIEILEEVATPSDLNEAEEFQIAYWKSLGFKLTNLTAGGGQAFTVMKWTPEMKKAQSERFKGLPHPWLKGKKQSPEHLLKRSTKGVPRGKQSPEHTINNALAQGARPFTDGTTVFIVKPHAAKILGVSVCLVKEVLKGHKSKKLNLWYVDDDTKKDVG